MKTILLSGASGFLGSALRTALERDGHRVIPLTRRAAPDAVHWDAGAGRIDASALARARPDVVINLAGEPIAQRWTSARRRRIRDSRVNGTRALAESVAQLSTRPELFIGGSAIGYYGAHPGDEILDEDAHAGSDWLGQVAQEWESAAAPARDAGIRVALVRTGVVLHRSGGMLGRILLPFRLGLGGRIGSGQQWMSWVSLEDWVRAVRFIIATPAVAGGVNVTAPTPVRNAEFTRAFGRVLRRPVIIPLPAFVLRLVFGDMARDTILADQRVIPKKLAGAGFEFRHPRVDDALRAALQ